MPHEPTAPVAPATTTRSRNPRPRDGSLTDLRERNLSRVMNTLLDGMPVTREDIELRAGILPTSQTKLVEALKDRQLVVEGDAIQTARRGRPTRPLELSRERWLLLGLIVDNDIISADLSYLTLDPLAQRRFPVDPSASTEGYLHELEGVILWAATLAAEQGMELLAIELASSGATSRSSGEVLRSLPNSWEGLPLAAAVTRMAERCPAGVHTGIAIHIDRVANYAMLARLQAMPREERGIAPTVYFGGRAALTGALHDGQTFYGATGLAGEYGHLIVDPDGRRCWCGRTGCLETKIGLPTLHAQLFDTTTLISDISVRGPALLADMLAAKEMEDPRFLKIMSDAGHWLGVAIDTIASVVNPARVIIDGFLARLGDPLLSTAIADVNHLRTFPAIHGLDIQVTDGDPSWILRGTVTAALHTVAAAPHLAR